MLDFIINWFSKKALDEFWSNYLKPLAFKDNHFRLRRLIAPSFAIVFGFIFYMIPDYIPSFARVLGYYDPASQQADGLSVIIHRLHVDQHYLRLTKDLVASSYIAVALFAWVMIWRSNYKKLNSLYEENKSVITFAHFIRLRDGSRCSTAEEKALINNKIAEKVASSKVMRAMVINGYHDLTDPDSPIKRALDSHRGNINLKVLLLDPLSSYAQKRATQLRQETDEYHSWMRYVRDYIKVTSHLDYLKEQHRSKVMYRTYCSKPFFRMYIFDNDLFLQSYHENQHGHSAPMYHYENGDGSLFKIGHEMFNYHWNRAFTLTETKINNIPVPLAVYLADMYGVSNPSDVFNFEDIKNRIEKHCSDIFKDARKLDNEGVLTDID